MTLGGLDFAVTLGVPRQQYQHVVATLPASTLSRLQTSQADGDGDDDPMLGGGVGAGVGAGAGAGAGVGAGAGTGVDDVTTPSSFVIAGPVAFSLSVCPDLESLLERADIEALAAKGPVVGSAISASQHLVADFLAMPVLKQKTGGARSRERSRADSAADL